MPVERHGAVTLKGKPLTLLGSALKVGDKAPDFKALANDLSEIGLDADSGKVRLYLSVPSLDTAVCDAETKRFNEEAEAFSKDVAVYTISCDLPFAQKRWCGLAAVNNLKTLSDHRDLSFGGAYGTWIKETRFLSRAVFLVDKKGVLQYVEYVPEVGEHPKYEDVLGAVKKLTA
ncbi:MAG TPA: thiol peroxidase [bacterium]